MQGQLIEHGLVDVMNQVSKHTHRGRATLIQWGSAPIGHRLKFEMAIMTSLGRPCCWGAMRSRVSCKGPTGRAAACVCAGSVGLRCSDWALATMGGSMVRPSRSPLRGMHASQVAGTSHASSASRQHTVQQQDAPACFGISYMAGPCASLLQSCALQPAPAQLQSSACRGQPPSIIYTGLILSSLHQSNAMHGDPTCMAVAGPVLPSAASSCWAQRYRCWAVRNPPIIIPKNTSMRS